MSGDAGQVSCVLPDSNIYAQKYAVVVKVVQILSHNCCCGWAR